MGWTPPPSAPTTAGSTCPFCCTPGRAARPPRSTKGRFSDTGATIFAHLTGGEPQLAGAPVDRLRPARGWRRYTPAQPRCRASAPISQAAWALSRRSRPPSGFTSASERRPPGRWCWDRVSPRPSRPRLRTARAEPRPPSPIDEVPHWRAGRMCRDTWATSIWRTHRGRSGRRPSGPHPWLRGLRPQRDTVAGPHAGGLGGEGMVLSSAAGAVAPDLAMATRCSSVEIVDLQNSGRRRRPDALSWQRPASSPRWCSATCRGESETARPGVHAAVPGPHYETAAELEALRVLGVDSVSMSLAAEVRAARDEGLAVAAFAVISNAGTPSHEEVLAGAGSAGERFGATVAAPAELLGRTRGRSPVLAGRRYTVHMTAVTLTHRGSYGHHDPPERRFRRSGGGCGRLPALSRGPDRLRRLAQSQRPGVRVPARGEPAHTQHPPDRPEQDPAADHRRHRRPRAHRRPGQACVGRPDVEMVVFDHHLAENPQRPAFVKGENWVLSSDGSVRRPCCTFCWSATWRYTRLEATIFALGIHEDTGSLTYPRTTIRDAEMLAASMRLGASQALIERYLHNASHRETARAAHAHGRRGASREGARRRRPCGRARGARLRGRPERHRPQAHGTDQCRGAHPGGGHGGPRVRHRPLPRGLGGRGRSAARRRWRGTCPGRVRGDARLRPCAGARPGFSHALDRSTLGLPIPRPARS